MMYFPCSCFLCSFFLRIAVHKPSVFISLKNPETQIQYYSKRSLDTFGRPHYKARLSKAPFKSDSVYYIVLRERNKARLIKESFKIAIIPSNTKKTSLRIVWKASKKGFIEGVKFTGDLLKSTNSSLSRDTAAVLVAVPLIVASAYTAFGMANYVTKKTTENLKKKNREIFLSSQKYKYDKEKRLIQEKMYVYEDEKEPRLLSVTRYYYKGSGNSVSLRIIQNKLAGKKFIKNF